MNPMSMLRPLAALTLGAALAAGQGAPAGKAAQAAAPSDSTLNPALKSRIFTLQHRSPNQLRDILAPLLSGARGSMIETLDRDGLQALSVRDFPENLAAVEDALKRLDSAGPARRQVEFHIQVLFASKQEGQGTAVPDELQDVLASLRSTLAFRSYTPVATFVQRAADGADLIEGEGQAEMAVRTTKGDAQQVPMDIRWGIDHLSVTGGAGTTATITFPKFQLTAWEHVGIGHGSRLASIETNLSMKDGEKVVVGTSMVKDKAMIIVLTAKVVD